MAQNKSQASKDNAPPTNLPPTEFAATTQKRLEDLSAIQAEQFQKFQKMSRDWLDRMQTEATLASEFSTNLTAARSLPEIATAYQDWASRHVEMATEDAQRIFADGQKLAETGARWFFNGWQANGRGGGT